MGGGAPFYPFISPLPPSVIRSRTTHSECRRTCFRGDVRLSVEIDGGRFAFKAHSVRTRCLLRRGDIVFMDNLNIHKMRRVRELIEAVRASVIYLPTYSPELNP